MGEPILKPKDMGVEEVKEICNRIYQIFLTPQYMLKHLTKIRNKDDIVYTLRGVKAVLGHLKDFGGRNDR